MRLSLEGPDARGDGSLPVVSRRVVGVEAVLIAARELVLLPMGVERGERVLPLPDDHHPDEDQRACHGQSRARDSHDASHIHPSNAFRPAWDARLLALTVRTVRLTVSLMGPRGGRSAALGYGA